MRRLALASTEPKNHSNPWHRIPSQMFSSCSNWEPDVNRVIERIVYYAAKVSDPEEIILFGSMANGTHNVHSDLDLLIVVDERIEKSQIAGLVKRYAYELSIAADVLVHTKQEVRESGARPNSFLAGVITSGKIVYRRGHLF